MELLVTALASSGGKSLPKLYNSLSYFFLCMYKFCEIIVSELYIFFMFVSSSYRFDIVI